MMPRKRCKNAFKIVKNVKIDISLQRRTCVQTHPPHFYRYLYFCASWKQILSIFCVTTPIFDDWLRNRASRFCRYFAWPRPFWRFPDKLEKQTLSIFTMFTVFLWFPDQLGKQILCADCVTTLIFVLTKLDPQTLQNGPAWQRRFRC